jgi:hypothetical protein
MVRTMKVTSLAEILKWAIYAFFYLIYNCMYNLKAKVATMEEREKILEQLSNCAIAHALDQHDLCYSQCPYNQMWHMEANAVGVDQVREILGFIISK